MFVFILIVSKEILGGYNVERYGYLSILVFRDFRVFKCRFCFGFFCLVNRILMDFFYYSFDFSGF